MVTEIWVNTGFSHSSAIDGPRLTLTSGADIVWDAIFHLPMELYWNCCRCSKMTLWKRIPSSVNTASTFLPSRPNRMLASWAFTYRTTLPHAWMRKQRLCTNKIQWNPSGKARNVSLKFVKFGPIPCPILYKSSLFYPSWQATSFERPPSRVAFI